MTVSPAANKPAWQGNFTSAELRASIPFDNGRQLRGHRAAELVDELIEVVDASTVRVRKRRLKDETIRRATIEALLANLVVAAFNRVDPARFVAMPFNTSWYSGTNLSVVVMREIRDSIGKAGFIEGVPGFYRQHHMPGFEFSRLTRLRATDALRDIFDRHKIDRSDVRCSVKQVIRLSRPELILEDRPADVQESESNLHGINRRLENAIIALPDAAWRRIRDARSRCDTLQADKDDPYAGDQTAVALHRVFTGNWQRGGRLYGGWWINLPKAERRLLTIDGETTIELDYARLHPTLLFARDRLPLTFDPYSFEGMTGDDHREMGKRTFSRLINPKIVKASGHISRSPKTRTPLTGKVPTTRMRATPEDYGILPAAITFQAYVGMMTTHLQPIARWFGSDVGMTLQREDSDLAIKVLSRLDRAGIVALPVHDSFIVKLSEVAQLRAAMVDCYQATYGLFPLIKPTDDCSPCSPPTEP